MTITLTVSGVAQPKGSTRAFVVRRKDGRLGTATTSANPKLKDWQHVVAAQMQQAAGRDFFARETPVSVSVTCYLPRPASLPKRVIDHVRKPDLDKLVRAVLDAGDGVLWADDAQVTGIYAAKRYSGPSVAPWTLIIVTDGEEPPCAS